MAKRQTKKKEIVERLQMPFLVGIDSFEGEIRQVQKFLEQIQEEVIKQGFDRGDIDINTYDDYGSCETEVTVRGVRFETDEEYQARMEKNEKLRLAGIRAAAKRRLKKEEKEREEYERLKQIYG